MWMRTEATVDPLCLHLFTHSCLLAPASSTEAGSKVASSESKPQELCFLHEISVRRKTSSALFPFPGAEAAAGSVWLVEHHAVDSRNPLSAPHTELGFAGLMGSCPRLPAPGCHTEMHHMGPPKCSESSDPRASPAAPCATQGKVLV